MQIPIVGLGEMSSETIKRMKSMLNKDFKKLKFYTAGRSEFPENSFNDFRDQYMAERLMDEFREDGIQVIVTDEDVYSKRKNYVFGESEYRGPAVVSTKRLDPAFYDREGDKEKAFRRMEKVAVHQLGHCFGMDNCENPGCVMNSPSSVKDLDDGSAGFCEECQVEISTKGLPLK
ncbi:MAG: hypothetical protein ACLFQ8_03100 [Candidatus Aenigmatarchaeota archaeon]